MLGTEDLTAKFRTLSYDHERMLLSMCRTANEQAANAERDTNVHCKSCQTPSSQERLLII